jgi:hypothetical protein
MDIFGHFTMDCVDVLASSLIGSVVQRREVLREGHALHFLVVDWAGDFGSSFTTML